jgi:hypothetical protein
MSLNSLQLSFRYTLAGEGTQTKEVRMKSSNAVIFSYIPIMLPIHWEYTVRPFNMVEPLIFLELTAMV